MKSLSRLLVAIVAACGIAAPASAAVTPSIRGPEPTLDTISAPSGPYEVRAIQIPDSATPGFGSATITYPASTAEGRFGGIAVSPGFVSYESAISWYGPRLASHGFVVITYSTQTIFDQPAARGRQLLAALDYLTKTSTVAARVDPSRLAVVGHSMGGGGTLEAAKARRSLKAAVALTPWDMDKTWPEITTPSLIVSAQNDTVAPAAQHATRFYQTLPASTPKSHLRLAGVGHGAPNSPQTTIAVATISWLKRFVDGDTRYTQFLCPRIPAPPGDVAGYDTTCPGWG